MTERKPPGQMKKGKLPCERQTHKIWRYTSPILLYMRILDRCVNKRYRWFYQAVRMPQRAWEGNKCDINSHNYVFLRSEKFTTANKNERNATHIEQEIWTTVLFRHSEIVESPTYIWTKRAENCLVEKSNRPVYAENGGPEYYHKVSENAREWWCVNGKCDAPDLRVANKIWEVLCMDRR